MLPMYYYFRAYNDTGSLIPIGGLKLYARRWKLNAAGEPDYETAEATLLNNLATVADNAYTLDAHSTFVDNSSASYQHLGGDFVFYVNADVTAGDGTVTLYLHRTTDGISSPTHEDSNGYGTVVCSVYVSGVQETYKSFSL